MHSLCTVIGLCDDSATDVILKRHIGIGLPGSPTARTAHTRNVAPELRLVGEPGAGPGPRGGTGMGASRGPRADAGFPVERAPRAHPGLQVVHRLWTTYGERRYIWDSFSSTGAAARSAARSSGVSSFSRWASHASFRRRSWRSSATPSGVQLTLT